MTVTIGQRVKRNDNGRTVRIVDLRPCGVRVFAVTEDMQDGHTAILDVRDLRPLTETSR